VSTRINTNIEALNAQRNLTATAAKYASSVEKLSSGLRINRAADDAAGLAISERLQAQVQGLNQAQRNAQDGVSMVQTAEGALNEVHSMLQRIRELSVEAANATLGQSDAASVNSEITALQAEINRIATTTTFNQQSLLTGSLSVSQSGGTINAGFVVAAGTNTSVSGLSVAGAKAATTYTLSSGGGAGTVTLSETTGGVTTSQTLTVSVMAAKSGQTLNFATMGVSISVASVAGETASNVAAGVVGAGTTIITGAGTSATFQVGANQGDTLTVGFQDARTSAYAGFDAAITAFTTAAGTTGWSLAAGALISATDTAIGAVSGIRANFGAVENRLQHTVASISVASENLTASQSRIKDLDVAAEMVNFTKNSILQQAGTSILAQANSAPQNILTLLR
jgi:flagellin